MKHILFLVTVLFFLSVATASEVAELAKQEKARREALIKQGVQSRVLTNSDIATLKSTLAMEVTGAAEAVTATTSEPPNAPSANEEKKQEINAHREEIEELKQEIVEQRKAAAEGGPYRSRDFGSQYRTIREQEELLRDLQQDLSDLESKKEEE